MYKRQAYDPDRWSNYFRPSGMQARTGDPTKAASPNATATSQSAPVVEASAPVVEPTPAPVAAEASATAPAGEGGDKAADILAMIRSRQSS